MAHSCNAAAGRLAATAVILLSVVLNNQVHVMGEVNDQQQMGYNQWQSGQVPNNPALQQQQPQALPTMNNNNRPSQQQQQQMPSNTSPSLQQIPTNPLSSNNQQQLQPNRNQYLPENQQQMPSTTSPSLQQIPTNQLSNGNPQQLQPNGNQYLPENQQQMPSTTIPSLQQIPTNPLLIGNQQQLQPNGNQYQTESEQQRPLNMDQMASTSQQQPQVFNPNQPFLSNPQQQPNGITNIPFSTITSPQQQQLQIPQQQPSGFVDNMNLKNNEIGLSDQQSLFQFQQQQQKRPQNANQPMTTSATTTGNPQQLLPNSKPQILSSNQQQQLPTPSQQLLSSQQQLPNGYNGWSLSNMGNQQQPIGIPNLPFPTIGGQQQQQPLSFSNLTSGPQQWPQQQQNGNVKLPMSTMGGNLPQQQQYIDNLPKVPYGVGDLQNLMQQQPLLQKFDNQFDQNNRRPQYNEQQLGPNQSPQLQQLSPENMNYQNSNLNGIHRFSQNDQPQDAYVGGQQQPGGLNGGNDNTGDFGLMNLVQQPVKMMQQPLNAIKQGGEQAVKLPLTIGQSIGGALVDTVRTGLDLKNSVMRSAVKPIAMLPQMGNWLVQMEHKKLDSLKNMLSPNTQPSTSSNMVDNNNNYQMGGSGQFSDPNKLQYSQQSYPQQMSGGLQYQQQSPFSQYYPQQMPSNQPLYTQQDNNQPSTQLRQNPFNRPQPIVRYSYNNQS